MVKLTKDMLMGDAIRDYPEIIEPLMEAGIHCVGCGAAAMESIGDGLRGHGFSEEEIDKFIKRLNASILDFDPEGFIVTERAVAKIVEMSEGEGRGLRVIAKRDAGCDGDGCYSYDLKFDEKKDGDIVLDNGGVKIYIAADSMKLLKGAKLDFITLPYASGFKIIKMREDALPCHEG